MLGGGLYSVVVGNHAEELAHLKGHQRIFFAEGSDAEGVYQGMEHWGWIPPLELTGLEVQNVASTGTTTSPALRAALAPQAAPPRRSSA